MRLQVSGSIEPANVVVRGTALRRALSRRTRTSNVTVTLCWCAAFALAGSLSAADDATAVFVMRVDGSQLRCVGKVDSFRKHGSPRWSHDGERILFDAAEGPDGAWKVFVVDADGSGLKEVGQHGFADWSADDQQVAMYSYLSKHQKDGVWVQNVDGKGRAFLGPGTSPRWSPDGTRIAMADDGALMILNLVSDERHRLLERPPGDIQRGFDWSPNRKQLAFVAISGATQPAQAQLWIADASDAERTRRMRLAGALDGGLAWSPDGRRLAIGLNDAIQLLEVAGDAEPELIAGQQGKNLMPAWSPDGQWIAFCSSRKTPELVTDAPPEQSLALEEVSRYSRGCISYSLAFSPDGRWAAFGGTERKKDLLVLDLASGETQRLNFYGAAVAASPNGEVVASAGRLIKIQLVDVKTGELIRDLHTDAVCSSLDYSPDGRRLLSGCNNGKAQVWDVAGGKRICSFKGHDKPITRVRFSPSGKEALTAGQDRVLRVWDAQSAQERLAIAHPGVVWGLAVSPDGGLIATGTGGPSLDNPVLQRMEQGPENVVRLWDAASGNLVREIEGHTNVVYALDFSPDGRVLASGGLDGTIRLWDVASGRQLANVQGKGPSLDVAFSPDGKQLLVAGGGNRVGNTRIETFPDEEIRLYRIVGPASVP